jgi:hypothetical protein
MSYHPSEQRCPRCRVLLIEGEPTCANCGLALAGQGQGGASRSSGSFAPRPWQQPGGLSGTMPGSERPGSEGFRSPGGSGPVGPRPGGQPVPDRSGSFSGPQNMPMPGRSGSFSGPQNAPDGWDSPPGQQAGGSAWNTPATYRDAPAGPRSAPPGYQNAPTDRRSTPPGWELPDDSPVAPASRELLPGPRNRSGSWDTPSSPPVAPASRVQPPAPRYVPNNWDAPDGWEMPDDWETPDTPHSAPGGWGSPLSTGGAGSGWSRARNTPGTAAGWGSPAGYGNAPGGWGSSTRYRDQGFADSETSAGFYEDEPAPGYRGSRAFRGAPGQYWQPDGQTWQRNYGGAPVAYPRSQYGYGGAYAPEDEAPALPMQPPPRRGKRTALILLVLLILLGAGGGGAYLFLRSRPVITVTSQYMVGTTPAGAATTHLHLTGTQFASHSAVSFLLDGQPEPGHQAFQSNANGALAGDLAVTADWPLGQHSLTAKDASGNTTVLGKTIVIVAQGEANTPGPKGAPADDTPSFKLDLVIKAHSKDTGQNETDSYTLMITGQPDPAGGKVCNPARDTGQPKTVTGTTDGLKYTETATVQCSGTYKGGKITYTETVISDKVDYSNGVSCAATAPFVQIELDGSFTSATQASGTLGGGTPTIACSNGRSITLQGFDGTWTGSIFS